MEANCRSFNRLPQEHFADFAPLAHQQDNNDIPGRTPQLTASAELLNSIRVTARPPVQRNPFYEPIKVAAAPRAPATRADGAGQIADPGGELRW